MVKILCFGDSITVGEKDTERGGWVDRLKQDYFAQSVNSQTQQITVYNLGIASETTDGLLKRFAAELGARNIRGQGLIVVLAYGANDIVIHKDKNIVPHSYFVRNLHSCIAAAKQLKADILLLNLLPIADAIEGIVDQQGKLRFTHDIQAYNSILEQLSLDMNCAYLDLYSAFVDNKQSYLCADGLHPNPAGHRQLYQLIKQKLATLAACNE